MIWSFRHCCCLILLLHLTQKCVVSYKYPFQPKICLFSSRRACAAQKEKEGAILKDAFSTIDTKAAKMTLGRMFVYSAALGPLLDNYHGLFNVLNYKEGVPLLLQLNAHTVLKTAIWVPPLFGFAGITMASLTLVGDSFLKTNRSLAEPSWSKVFYGISFFSAQYYLSGLLDSLGLPSAAIHLILASLACLGFLLFDTSFTGLLVGICTALAGPAAELLLINGSNGQLYSYTHADWFGICSWIPWVYLLGAPAVGNLARRVYLDETR